MSLTFVLRSDENFLIFAIRTYPNISDILGREGANKVAKLNGIKILFLIEADDFDINQEDLKNSYVIYYYRKLSFMDQNSLDGKIVVPQLAEEAGTLIFLKLLK